MTVLVSLAEVVEVESRAGEALRAMVEDEGLSLREAVAWCNDEVTVRQATRLKHWPECAASTQQSRRECRAATPADRGRGVGVFAMPAPSLGADQAVVRLVAEVEGVDPDEAVAEQRRISDECSERNLAGWRRRDEQPWDAWFAEEQATTPPSAKDSKGLVDRLVAEIEAIAQGEAEQDRTEESR